MQTYTGHAQHQVHRQSQSESESKMDAEMILPEAEHELMLDPRLLLTVVEMTRTLLLSIWYVKFRKYSEVNSVTVGMQISSRSLSATINIKNFSFAPSDLPVGQIFGEYPQVTLSLIDPFDPNVFFWLIKTCKRQGSR